MGNVLKNSQGNVLISNNNAFEISSSVDSNIIPENIKKDVTILEVTGTYEGSGGSSIINFTINNVSYQSDNGMEWYDWVSSSYNTGGFTCSGYTPSSCVRSPNNLNPVLYMNWSVRPWDIIASGRDYYYSENGGSND